MDRGHRTTRAELDSLAEMIDGRLFGWMFNGQSRKPMARDHFIQYAYGRPRLVRRGGSVEVSPRLSKGQLAMWMQAYLAGMDVPR